VKGVRGLRLRFTLPFDDTEADGLVLEHSGKDAVNLRSSRQKPDAPSNPDPLCCTTNCHLDATAW